MGPQPNEVRRNALQFHHHYADVLRALRHFEAKKFFHRETVNQIVPERIQVVHPVRQRNHLRIGLVFAGFFDPRVQVPKVRNRLHYGFAVKLQQNAQHPVRRWVLRPHVEDHGFCRADGGFNGGHGVELFLKSSPVFGTSR